MFNFKNWFLCQFSSNIWFFLAGALSIPQKLENAKMNLPISIQGDVKLKKREGGGCHGRNGSQNFRFYKCYDILWQTPPYGEKKLLKSEKNILQIFHLVFWWCWKIFFLLFAELEGEAENFSSLSFLGPVELWFFLSKVKVDPQHKH